MCPSANTLGHTWMEFLNLHEHRNVNFYINFSVKSPLQQQQLYSIQHKIFSAEKGITFNMHMVSTTSKKYLPIPTTILFIFTMNYPSCCNFTKFLLKLINIIFCNTNKNFAKFQQQHQISITHQLP